MKPKETALGYETLGGRALQGLVTLLELVVAPYLRRRRAARPASASRESVAVVGSGTGAVNVTSVTVMPLSEFDKEMLQFKLVSTSPST